MTQTSQAALYRRYRPETFADVIGQEHVTEPLMQALRSGRVNHAYLFSGPRGCGKTTSARILARCLNCEQGPTPTPCGECSSCVALARGGAGTVDVIEIDAASHGGVDDARDLRERASYGPAQSRFKIYIIDEAHMVTPQGFNALLKIVEEPPEHVKFVFATTEPEKVIGTIRSRTHHYPFRLVPPGLLADYMQTLCDAEGVRVEPGVLSFVTRAGGGSVRDSLSVLDQLIAGSGDEGVTYAGAASLLGFTDGELLDATVDALAARDSASVFRQIDKVIESGHDPRRFIEDMLERLRDLIIVAAVPDGAGQVLRAVPEDQLERMRQQSAAFGAGALSRAADIANTGLTEMTGATAPRLQLELICARILLPAASGEQGYAARLDRLERRLDMGQLGGGTPAAGAAPTAPAPTAPAPAPAPAASAPAAASAPSSPPASTDRPAAGDRSEQPSKDERRDEARPTAPSGQSASPEQQQGVSAPAARAEERPAVEPGAPEPAAPTQSAAPTQPPSAAPAPVAGPPGAVDTDAIRREWPSILDRIAQIKRVTWALVSQNAQVLDYDGQRLLLGTSTAGLAETFRRGPHPDIVRQALNAALGVDVRVEAQPHDGPPPQAPPPQAPPPSGPPAADGPSSDDAPQPPSGGGASQRSAGQGDASHGPTGGGADATALGAATPRGGWDSGPADSWGAPSTPPPAWAQGDPAPAGRAGEPPRASRVETSGTADGESPQAAPGFDTGSASASPGSTSGAGGGSAGGGGDGLTPRQRAMQAARATSRQNAEPAAPVADDSAADRSDEDIEESGAVGVPVIQSVLGGTIIAEGE
ncbi:DNA polymerase III subunit gamma and tau [Luteipulveratus halotolerans]|uniref:DNA polymerase III subunit gamma/tau n=1 Tax=Luteipulveratus halotolerans TaxID=1631356 RepID=A0A0L6CEY9_9MICO|nr:DNA polymerase III subunit gamma and tau [Luteipulveratus halotolerans]KNX36063.1 DNA polymerase III subunit gamma/tau [Luteipulveratus halotolerans]